MVQFKLLRRNDDDRLGVCSKFVCKLGLSNFFSSQIGLDTQIYQSQDLSQPSLIGPVPGDIAEVEAYCRIFRCTEDLHIAIMDTLCNPVTGECEVSYDSPSQDIQLLEEEVVAVLGCMVALLNKGREDVLSGRSSFMKSFNVDDMLPPLANFRIEMKRCCRNLDIALGNYLTPSDGRSTNIWRRLQRLKNVCYDAGFPRGDGCPCQTLFANWTPVYLSEDCDVAFYKGGQVTDESLEWLVEKGFKTIVDLRAETVKNEFYKAAVDNAISCRKVEVIQLPVEVQTAPSVEQVEKFASLVLDSNKTPLYLHSQEGIWRTSAMISRWKQYVARSKSLFVPNLPTKPDKLLSKDSKLKRNGELHIPLELKGHDDNSSPSSTDASLTANNTDQSETGDINGFQSSSDTTSIEGTNRIAIGFPANPAVEVEPLNAQIPACDVFSRREMSSFFKSKKVAPATYFSYNRKRLEKSLVSRNRHKRIVEKSSSSVLAQEESSNGLIFSKPQSSVSNKEFFNEDNRVSFHVSENGSLGNNMEKKVLDIAIIEESKGNIKTSIDLDDKGLVLIEGDMCASTTGVVRIQSRKKAEMFLVRTDGFSCSREKVTESSLAFTHPSTQQQMLMWKSPPKTVLLLKKLGQELMDEAKQVASFLYHQEKMNVLVEPDVHDIFARIPGFGFVQTFYNQDCSDLHERVDFVACLGGDGVILHASNLFRGAVPPVVSFNLGSLGFLTSHSFDDYRHDIRQLIHGNNTTDGVYITLRMRLRCEIFRNGKAMPGKVFDVLNEIVVDRGSNPYLSKIECYEHNRLITKVQGDGVIVATPTGSTAYSTAAGGSMVHPNVPCMLFTPICPHSLSFRPVILPDSAQLELKIPDDTRSNAWVSFDGKRRQQLSRGDSVRIYMSNHPLPTVNKSDQTGDWFHSLIRCLNWNERMDQKAL